MSYAYTPGLKVKRLELVRKARMLPVPGEIHVNEGDEVTHDIIVAQTFLPGDIEMIPLFYIIGVEPWELPKVMLKKEGDKINEGELLATAKAFFGLFKSNYYSKHTGTIELISDVTGMVGIRCSPFPIDLYAYIPGKVCKVIPNQGVIIETAASLIQGIFGVGGERHGEIMMIAGADEKLTLNHLKSSCEGKVLVGGSLVTAEVLKEAEEIGAQGIVTGGIDRIELINYLEHDIGVAITGDEDIGLTCIITEGFGRMAIASHTYKLLTSHEGKLASLNGATQIRAGVIRPEIIIPLDQSEVGNIKEGGDEFLAEGIYPGTRVRVIRQPYFGAVGTVESLQVELQKLSTESTVRVMTVKLDDGRAVIIPRANAEIMEE